jgi:hypothetical protein
VLQSLAWANTHGQRLARTSWRSPYESCSSWGLVLCARQLKQLSSRFSYHSLHSAYSHLPLLLVCWSVARKLAGRNEPPRGTSLPRAATTSLGGAPFSPVMSNGYSLHFPFLLLYLRLRQLQAPALASRLVGISRCQEGFSISVPPSPRFSLFIPRGFFIVFPPHHPTYILQIDECLPIVCVRVVPCAPPPP